MIKEHQKNILLLLLGILTIGAIWTTSDYEKGISDAAYNTSRTQQYWHNGVLQSTSKSMTFTGTTTGGTAVFYMTSNGLVGGSALCSSMPSNITIGLNDSGNTFGSSATVTNSFKTLTITVNARGFTSVVPPLLGISLLNTTTLTSAPNGTPVSVSVNCT